MRVLILGGTRNLGPDLVAALLARGDTVTVVHRGVTPFPFPPAVETLHADRTDPAALRAVLGTRTWDLVVDMVLFTGPEAQSIVGLLHGRVGRYLALSTGQVYLVRLGLERPFPESSYDGPLMPEPPPSSDPRVPSEQPDWQYGISKRHAEDTLFHAHRTTGFPVTTLRLPMINSRRDHFQRLRNYIVRILDGEPLLLPAGPHLPLRHVSGDDTIAAILHTSTHPAALGTAWNISSPTSVALSDFLGQLAALLGRPLRTSLHPRADLVAAGLLRFCSPFSDPWMSALDSTRSLALLGVRYTPFADSLRDLVDDALQHPITPAGYTQRPRELHFLATQPTLD